MSHLFSRISSKLSSSPLKRSGFSTTTPYLLLGSDSVGKSPCGGKIVNLNLYDPAKEEHVKMENQILSKDLRQCSTIGSSRGWLAMKNKRDSTVRLTNSLNNPSKTISLPPLIKDETERLLNVSVSSSDCVVAVRFYGSRLSLCRLGDSEWTRLNVPCPAFRLSPVMYSDRDSKFYLNSVSSDYTGPTDFTSKSGLVSPVSGYVRFPLHNFPELENNLRLQRINVFLLPATPSSFFGIYINYSVIPLFSYTLLCYSSVFIYTNYSVFVMNRYMNLYVCVCTCLRAVDCFTVKGEAVAWEDKMYKDDNFVIKTHKIMVFRQDNEKGILPYTEDIGDLCIFVGENEPFCLSASDYPGLKPNSVYFAGHCSGFGVCDLASRTIRYLSDSPLHHRLFWIPPTTPPQ